MHRNHCHNSVLNCDNAVGATTTGVTILNRIVTMFLAFPVVSKRLRFRRVGAKTPEALAQFGLELRGWAHRKHNHKSKPNCDNVAGCFQCFKAVPIRKSGGRHARSIVTIGFGIVTVGGHTGRVFTIWF